ncbi:MAG: signal peptidase II [Planctomycetota bacterium]
MEDSLPVPRSRVWWFLALAVLGCTADLLSKHLVFEHPQLFHGSEWWLWQGHAGIQKSLNEGALFGMGQGKVWLFAAFSAIALIGIPVWLFGFRAAHDRWLNFALGCVTGGILGNLYDRLGLPGLGWDAFNPAREGEDVYAVRDWILLQWDERWVWPNFNIADMLLVGGACALMIQALFFAPTIEAHTASSRDNNLAD